MIFIHSNCWAALENCTEHSFYVTVKPLQRCFARAGRVPNPTIDFIMLESNREERGILPYLKKLIGAQIHLKPTHRLKVERESENGDEK